MPKGCVSRASMDAVDLSEGDDVAGLEGEIGANVATALAAAGARQIYLVGRPLKSETSLRVVQ